MGVNPARQHETSGGDEWLGMLLLCNATARCGPASVGGSRAWARGGRVEGRAEPSEVARDAGAGHDQCTELHTSAGMGTKLDTRSSLQSWIFS